MTVIKSGESVVRPVLTGTLALARSGAHQAQVEMVDPELEAARLEIVRLEGLVAAKQTQLLAAEQNVRCARAEGEAAGRATGIQEGLADKAELVMRLEAALKRALHSLDRNLSSVERLAPLLAREALERVFAADGGRTALVTDILSKQLHLLRREAELIVEVSAQDFPCPPDIEELKTRLQRPELRVTVDPSLGAGDCRIRTRLGQIDVGVAQQWEALSGVLTDLAAPGTGQP